MGCGWNYKNVGEVFTEMAVDDAGARQHHAGSASSARTPSPIRPTAPDKPGRDVVFDDGFPRPGGFAKLVATKLQPPDEVPDEEYPFILTTGRQLEHWHTGSMTRRATVLDAIEPSAIARCRAARIEKLGIQPGDMIRVVTRRGTVELAARQDDAIPDGVVFIPFAYVEAAANLLTNPKLDPFGKIPEFKFCAAQRRRRCRTRKPRSSFLSLPRLRARVAGEAGRVGDCLKWPGLAQPFCFCAGRDMTLHMPEPKPDPDQPETDAERRRTNLVLLGGAGVLIVGGVWLVNALVDARKAEECFESGRRNCK